MTCTGRRHISPRWEAVRISLMVLILASGCGDNAPDRVNLTGEVTYNGKPVADGIISLQPIGGGGTATSASIESGRYAFSPEQSPLPGEYRVEIEGFRKTGRKIPDLVSPVSPGQPPATIDEKAPYVPPKHNTNSKKTITVSHDNSTADIHLER